MKYVDFFGHKVSKLLVGDNPFNGHSYITHVISKDEMIDYHTEDKILEAMHKMEDMGINTMLPLADPYIIRILRHYRANGGKMNFIFQTYAPFMMTLETVPVTMRMMLEVEPIGIYLSGTFIDSRYENNKMEEIAPTLKKMREFPVPLGMGTHYPEIITRSVEENWDIDFYMACMYNFRKGREGQESGFITGKSKSDVVIVPKTDRAVMLDALKDVKKPIIAFKIFAGGQMLVEKEESERRMHIKDTYDTIFNALKPDDLAVMGVFQKYHDQIAENVSVFNEWESEQK
ncbi:MAG: hypothetical protein E7411_08915 [Ruminococcaceae bacterium]|nr:hypothetical protein [Oscillospiraceae bacterium]